MKKQRRISGRIMYLIDDSKHCNFDLHFQPQLPPIPQKHTKSCGQK